LREAPNQLLKRYFQERSMLLDLDFDALQDEADIESVYQAWQALPKEQYQQVERDF